MKKIWLAFCLCLLSTASFAEWKLVMTKSFQLKDSSQTSTASTHADTDTLEKNGDIYKVRLLSDLNFDGKTFSIERLVEFDCKENREKNVRLIMYSGAMGKGEANDATQSDPNIGKWRSIGSSSPSYELLQKVCAL